MSDSPPIVPPDAPWEADTLLEIASHLGAALIQADPADDRLILNHVRDAHQLAIDLYRKSQSDARSFAEVRAAHEQPH